MAARLPTIGQDAQSFNPCVLLISGAAVLPIEFKCGATSFSTDDFDQARDYALDLENFHAGSRDAAILPVLVATAGSPWRMLYGDGPITDAGEIVEAAGSLGAPLGGMPSAEPGPRPGDSTGEATAPAPLTFP